MKFPDPGIPFTENESDNCQCCSPQLTETSVTVFKECDSKTKEPVFETQKIKVIVGTESQEQLKFFIIAQIEARQCKDSCIATVPEWWQLRPEVHRPQLICVFVEEKKDKTLGHNYYSITIPHPKSSEPPEKPPIPNYKKGSWEAILTLKNNSKVIVNAVSKEECTKMIDAIKPEINKDYVENSSTKIGKEKDKSF